MLVEGAAMTTRERPALMTPEDMAVLLVGDGHGAVAHGTREVIEETLRIDRENLPPTGSTG